MEKRTFLSSIIKGDNWLWGIFIILMAFSLVEMFSASSRLAYLSATNDSPAVRHTMYLLIGFVVAIVFQSSTLRGIRLWDKVIFVGGFILLIALYGMGVSMKGATRSVAGIQPVEVCKIGTMMFLCWAITAPNAVYHKIPQFRQHTEARRFIAILVAVFAVCLLIFLQNLSSALIIGISSMIVMFLGGVRRSYLVKTSIIIALGGAVALGLLWAVHQDDLSRQQQGLEIRNLYVAQRSHTWASRIFDSGGDKPLWEQSIHGDQAQVLHAHMALANSFPLPTGIGNSKLRDFLPEAYSDYIFAIIFEEWGFVGAAIVIFLYLALLMRCYILSKRTADPYIRLMMVALPLIMTIQALIHIGVCTDAMFVTGQPLPLISRGGSSIIMTSMAFGFLFALSRLISVEERDREQAAAPNPTASGAETTSSTHVSNPTDNEDV